MPAFFNGVCCPVVFFGKFKESKKFKKFKESKKYL